MEGSTNLDKLTENAKEVLANSYLLAKDTGSSEVLLEHVFIALLSLDKGLAARFLRSLGIDMQKTIESITNQIRSSENKGEIGVSEKVKELVKSAFLLASEFGHVYVGTEHILLAFMRHKEVKFIKELEVAGFDYEAVKERLFSYATYAPGVFMRGKKKQKEERDAISYFGKSLNQLAKEGKLMPIIGRDKEIDRMIRILSRQTKNNPILVGEAGVGKTAVVEGLVQKLVRGEVPESMKNLEVYQVDLAAIIAGSKVRGDVEQRLLALISEVAASPNKVLFIDEIHMIVGAGATGADRTMDVANILKPRLTDGSVRVIGATTTAEYRQYFDEDSALSRRFQPIFVDEITPADTISILRGIKSRLEEYHGVKITKEAISATAKLSARYITDRFLPDKAIDVLDEAAAAKKLKREEAYKGYGQMVDELATLKKKKDKAIRENNFEKALDYRQQESLIRKGIEAESKRRSRSIKKGIYKVEAEDIKIVISEWTGVPVTTMSATDLKSLQGITKRIEKRIIGQKDAVDRVTSTLKRARLGLSDERRPLASFLFLGPTGVGKTELAKVIAQEFFGSEKSLIQVDMSEFMEQHSVAKIIGAPPGYVGYQEGGHLTEQVRKRPYSVVLFDEIEKAHQDLLNIMLQILEEGHITDSKGRKVNFKNTIIIMTSNIGAQDIGKDKVLGFRVSADQEVKVDAAYERMREKLTEELKKVLRPELINRIDDVVIFRGLDEIDAVKIVKLLLRDVERRLAERKVSIDIDKPSMQLIAKLGFSDEYGARNLRRKIQELVENPLSDLLLEKQHEFSHVQIAREGKQLKFTPSA